MSDNNLGAVGLIAGAVAVVSIVAGVTVGTMHSRTSDERERIVCIESSGTSLKTSSGPVCIGDDK